MTSLLSGTARGQILTCGIRMTAVVLALGGALLCHASSTETNYNGHYDLAGAKTDRVFSLEVQQTGSKAKVSFFVAMADSSAVMLYASGSGRVEDGLLSFAFKDNFNNEGACTLKSMNDGYHLSMTVSKVIDSSPFHFYGNVLLKKTSEEMPPK